MRAAVRAQFAPMYVSSLPLDLPKPAASAAAVQMTFTVALHASGEIDVDDERVGGVDRVLALAKVARADNPEIRGVIRADGKVSHARVIEILDVLKQAGISKIAFAVTPASDR